MKKAILLSTLTTILTLSLAGCGSTGGLEDSVGVQNSTAPTGPIAPVIAESLVPTECPENGPADDLAISMGNEAICDLGPVQFSLSLPETWDYEIRNLTFAGTTTTDAIIFWNIAYPEDTFTLIYAPVPGICGTGVTSEEITLPDSNLNGWKNTDRTKILDLHYIIQSRCPFTGKYPTAGSHYSVNRLVHSGNRFQPHPRNHPASIYKFRSSCDAGYSDLTGRNAVNDSRHSALARRNAVRSPRQVTLVRRKTVQLYRAGYGFRCTCDSGYSDPARTNSTCNSGETAPVGTKAVQLY